MIIPDEIRNYTITTALPSELIKTSREYHALAILKYSYPEWFSGLYKSESPDLQDSKGSLGVEVTWGGSPLDEIISGESYKFTHAKNVEEKEKCLEKIRKYGGDRDEMSITFPVGIAESDKNNVLNVFKKKLKKVKRYRKNFTKIGLAILLDIPLFLFINSEWWRWLIDVNKSSYDFVVLIHWSGTDMYCFDLDKYYNSRICREDMDAINKLARLTAEGLISDTDEIWTDLFR